MSLYSSIKAIQNNIEKTYLVVEKRFSGNKAIRDLWSRMVTDVSQQIDSLQKLPKSFWIRLKKDQEELLGTIKREIQLQDFDNSEDLSLSDCIEKAIESEEAMILKIYVPLIRNLRKNWSGRELNFYIMVKAHIVRFQRVAQAYSGDPQVLQRATNLIERFEKEVQEPEVDLTRILRPVRKVAKLRGTAALKRPRSKTEKRSKPEPAPKRAKTLTAAKSSGKAASKPSKGKTEERAKPKTASKRAKPLTPAKSSGKAAPKPSKGKTEKRAKPKTASKRAKPLNAVKSGKPSKKGRVPERSAAKRTRMPKTRPGKPALRRKRASK